MEKKNRVLMSILGVFALIIVTVGATYAFFTYTRTGTTESVIKTSTGEISFVYTNDENGVTLSDAVPMATDTGKALTNAYEFSIAALMTTNATINYTITAVNTTGTPEDGKIALRDDQIRAYLTEVSGETETPLWDEVESKTKLLSEVITTGTEGSLYTGSLTTTVANASQSKEFKLRIWIDSEDASGNVNASDEGTGTINPGDNYTVDESGTKVTADTRDGIYSLKIKVTANAVASNQ